MHAEEPVIESNEFRVLPIGIHQVNEIREFLKTEQKEKMRIPVPPEMPETAGGGAATVRSAEFSAICHHTQHKDERRRDCLRADQHPRVRQVM